MTVVDAIRRSTGRDRDLIAISTLLGVFTVLIFVFAQTRPAYFGDEQIALLQAWLISNGKRPYLDFFCPYTPLYLYSLAGWMWLFGQTWRSAHAFSALLASATMVLTVTYVFSILRGHASRLRASALTACVIAINPLFLVFGSIAHYYSLACSLRWLRFGA